MKSKKGRKRTRLVCRLVWSPKWDKSIQGWTAKFIRKNKWRCESINEFDDLMNDAYLTFAMLVERYPRVVEPQHFMSLYKTTMHNKFHDQARLLQTKRKWCVDTSVDAIELCSARIGDVTNDGYLNALIAEAPIQLRKAIELFTEHPEAIRLSPEGRRENLNMRLTRALGAPPGFDYMGQLKSLLK